MVLVLFFNVDIATELKIGLRREKPPRRPEFLVLRNPETMPGALFFLKIQW